MKCCPVVWLRDFGKGYPECGFCREYLGHHVWQSTRDDTEKSKVIHKRKGESLYASFHLSSLREITRVCSERNIHGFGLRKKSVCLNTRLGVGDTSSTATYYHRDCGPTFLWYGLTHFGKD